MMTKSQADNKGGDEVYQWIEFLQNHPKDTATQEKIILAYKNLVESIAMKYAKNPSIYEDLVQVGMIGLLGAVRRYDPSLGKSFEAFAIPTIIGEIKRYIRDKTWSVYVPRRIKELGPKIRKAIDALTIADQKSPKVKDIADYLGVSEEEILETMEMSQSYHALSVDKKVENQSTESSSVSMIDLIGLEDNGYRSIDNKLILEKLLPILTKREKEVINYTYFQNMSQKDAGERLGISQMHVSRIQRRALEKLRGAVQSKESEDFT